jgi:hypothetical protein
MERNATLTKLAVAPGARLQELGADWYEVIAKTPDGGAQADSPIREIHLTFPDREVLVSSSGVKAAEHSSFQVYFPKNPGSESQMPDTQVNLVIGVPIVINTEGNPR